MPAVELATETRGINERLTEVRRRLSLSALRSGRPPETVRLIAVSKTHPARLLAGAVAAGVTEFGENRVQEAEAKIAELGREGVQWHLIGHLQANKARRAVKLFDLIHTLDSPELATRLERLCAEEGRERLDVLLQVDLGGEATKAGVAEAELPQLAEAVQGCRHLRLMGLMTLPPYCEEVEAVRPFFRRLRELRDNLAGAFAAPPGELSMGMSHDYETAVEEGATMVRVGTAIFGARAPHHS